MGSFKLSSAAFKENSLIPEKYTCDGDDLSPPLVIENIPDNTESLALIVDDPDAPAGTWVHWVLCNIHAGTSEIREGEVPAGAVEGMNDFRNKSYGGPCPPSGTHRYFFKLYALDSFMDLSAGSEKGDLEKAMKGHVIDETHLIGLYKRS